MKLVENETYEQDKYPNGKQAESTPETEVDPEPAVDLLPITLATMLPVGMIESLKAIRHEIAVLHGQVVKAHGMVPAFLSGAYTAIDDAETFLKNVANGKEEFTPVPKKPVLKEENTKVINGTVLVPSNLKDIPYMQEWAGTFFFPKLREMTVRKDVEVDLRADMNKKKKLHLVISVTLPNEPAVLLPTQYSANAVIDLAAVAKSIDAL